ncbi:MAG: hypothetical protein JWR23_1576 [Mucilaginibacter sp.]|nr:hypothetical protein [Mucilaginibacter sp.]
MLMRLFRKRIKTSSPNRVASQIERAIAKKQRQVADYLNRKTQHWNRASKLILLLLICLVFGGASLWLLVIAFN